MAHKSKSEMKFERVMREFANGKLESHGTKVTDQKQALAIAFSEARKINPEYGIKKEGGGINPVSGNRLTPSGKYTSYAGKTGEDFELGTPVVFGKESGEVVKRDGKIGISLYPDRNYSGNEERIVFPKDWNNVKTFAEANKMSEGGKLDDIYRTGTAQQLWNAWDEKQRKHFLTDHLDMFRLELGDNPNEYIPKLSEASWNMLPKEVRKEVVIHHAMGIYAGGGRAGEFLSEAETRQYIQNLSEEDWNRLKPENKEKYKKYRIGNKSQGGRITPAKKKLQDRIAVLKRTMESANSTAQKSIQKKIDVLQAKLDYNPSLKEKIAAQKGRFYLDVPTEYAKRIYRQLCRQGIKSKLHNLHGSTKVVVDHTRKLDKAYKIYSDILKEKSMPVPSLSKIKGKL